MVSCYCKEFYGLFNPSTPCIIIGKEKNLHGARTGAKPDWRAASLNQFLIAQQNSANTLHRQLEEEEGFGTDSRLQVLGWKRLDKYCIVSNITNCTSRQEALGTHYFWPHPFIGWWTQVHWLHPLWKSNLAWPFLPGIMGKRITNWVGLLLGIR